MSSAQLAEWMVYYTLEPWGDELIDIQLATTNALLANAHRDKSASPRPVNDFRLWKLNAVQASANDLWQRLRSWALHAREDQSQ
jgi:hypothetical protein